MAVVVTGRSGRFEDDHRDLAAGLRLVLGEAGVLGLLAGPDGLALVGAGDAGPEAAGLGAHLGGGVGVGAPVVVPVGVVGRPRLGGEDGNGSAQVLVHHRADALLAGAGTSGVEQQQRGAVERAAHLAV